MKLQINFLCNNKSIVLFLNIPSLLQLYAAIFTDELMAGGIMWVGV